MAGNLPEAILPGRRDRTVLGFTLLELLVVLAILALGVGLVGAVAMPGEREVLRREAERLALLLDLAVQASSMSGRPMAWTAEASGYRFHGSASGMPKADEFRPRALPERVRITALRIEGVPQRGPMLLEIPAFRPPRAFSIELALGTHRYEVVGSALGDVHVLPAGDAVWNGAQP